MVTTNGRDRKQATYIMYRVYKKSQSPSFVEPLANRIAAVSWSGSQFHSFNLYDWWAEETIFPFIIVNFIEVSTRVAVCECDKLKVWPLALMLARQFVLS